MKRSIYATVSALALFAATPALADNNTSSVNQPGNASQAYVTQQGTNSNSSVTQSGADNWVSVNQGTGNNSANNNVANVSQNGADMAGDPTANPSNPDDPYAGTLSNIASVDQNGDDGQATVTQTGNNRAAVTQSYAPGGNQRATINQISDPFAGTENYAATTQRGVNLEANVGQYGNGNWATVSQVADPSTTQTENLIANVSQIGMYNTSMTNQNNSTNSNSFTSQNGNGNFANAKQAGDQLDSDILQSDDAHSADVSQSGSQNTSYVSQSGYSNDAKVKQASWSNESYIYQSGSENGASVSQNELNSLSTVNQSGSYNIATVTQGAPLP